MGISGWAIGRGPLRGQGATGITVSYWDSLDAIDGWRKHVEHREVQCLGREAWYDEYVVRVARVERTHSFDRAGD